MAHSEQISRRITDLNETWRAGRFDELDGFYHPDVVLLPPDAGEPIVGRTAVVASYRDFADAATLHEFRITSVDTFAFDPTYVCHLRFEIEYSIDGGHFSESGLEVYVLSDKTKDPTQARIVWRSQTVLDVVEILPRETPD